MEERAACFSAHAPKHFAPHGCCRAAKGEERALQTLDLSGNRIARAPELAVLAGCPHLRQLTLLAARGAGGEALGSENPVCALPGLRAAVAAALPHIDALDGAPVAPERATLPHASAPGAAAQARHQRLRKRHLCDVPLVQVAPRCRIHQHPHVSHPASAARSRQAYITIKERIRTSVESPLFWAIASCPCCSMSLSCCQGVLNKSFHIHMSLHDINILDSGHTHKHCLPWRSFSRRCSCRPFSRHSKALMLPTSRRSHIQCSVRCRHHQRQAAPGPGSTWLVSLAARASAPVRRAERRP